MKQRGRHVGDERRGEDEGRGEGETIARECLGAGTEGEPGFTHSILAPDDDKIGDGVNTGGGGVGRISLTFHTVTTFFDPYTDRLYGEGQNRTLSDVKSTTVLTSSKTWPLMFSKNNISRT